MKAVAVFVSDWFLRTIGNGLKQMNDSSEFARAKMASSLCALASNALTAIVLPHKRH